MAQKSEQESPEVVAQIEAIPPDKLPAFIADMKATRENLVGQLHRAAGQIDMLDSLIKEAESRTSSS